MKNWPRAAAFDQALRPHRGGGGRSARGRPLHHATLGRTAGAPVIADPKQGIARLAEGEGAFRELGALYPALRVAHCAHHYVFCLPRENAPALIVAIFHETHGLDGSPGRQALVPLPGHHRAIQAAPLSPCPIARTRTGVRTHLLRLYQPPHSEPSATRLASHACASKPSGFSRPAATTTAPRPNRIAMTPPTSMVFIGRIHNGFCQYL